MPQCTLEASEPYSSIRSSWSARVTTCFISPACISFPHILSFVSMCLLCALDAPLTPSTGFWTLDPIDGTKGFLRGEQYAVCLALIVDARVELGVIGCPNLPTSASSSERGCVFVAARGAGAWQLPLHPSASAAAPIRLAIPAFKPDELNLLESVEKAHAKLSFNDKVAEVLGVTRPPTRMDSQAKYCALVRGDGGVYLRMPVGSGYREKIWVRCVPLFLV